MTATFAGRPSAQVGPGMISRNITAPKSARSPPRTTSSTSFAIRQPGTGTIPRRIPTAHAIADRRHPRPHRRSSGWPAVGGISTVAGAFRGASLRNAAGGRFSPVTNSVSIPQPALFFGERLKAGLETAGIRVRGELVHNDDAADQGERNAKAVAADFTTMSPRTDALR